MTGSLLFGASLWAVAAAFVGLTVLTSQVFDSRSRALGAGAALLGTALVLRMVANSADSRSWIAWVTPLGWFDHLQPFGDDRALVLLVPVGVVTVLVTAAVALRVSRDSRAGWSEAQRRSRKKIHCGRYRRLCPVWSLSRSSLWRR